MNFTFMFVCLSDVQYCVFSNGFIGIEDTLNTPIYIRSRFSIFNHGQVPGSEDTPYKKDSQDNRDPTGSHPLPY